MNRPALNFAIDTLSLVFFIAMAITGFIMWGPLPPGTNKDFLLWGLSRHQWGDIHLWASIGLLVVLVVHLGMHWKWIVAIINKKAAQNSRQVLIWGIVFATIFSLAFAAFAWLSTISVKKTEDKCSELLEFFLPQTAYAEELPRALAANPILESKCYSCHGPKKASGDLRLDDNAALQIGTSPWVVLGDPIHSRLIKFLRNPPSDMKKRAKHLLSPDELEELEAWIRTGQ